MSKTIEPVLKDFHKLISDLAYTHSSHGEVFTDFVNYAINRFSIEPDIPFDGRHQQRYNEQEQHKFEELFKLWIITTNENLTTDAFEYIDLLGNYYEFIASNYKKSAFGQYFTPESIVELLTKLNVGEPDGELKTVNDCCCGSGRMLLSAHMQLKGQALCYGEDIDPLCCKMTVLNMLIHGLEGEVVQHNSLASYDFIRGWKVNEQRRKGKVFFCREISPSESRIMQYRDNEPPPKPEPPPQPVIIEF